MNKKKKWKTFRMAMLSALAEQREYTTFNINIDLYVNCKCKNAH